MLKSHYSLVALLALSSMTLQAANDTPLRSKNDLGVITVTPNRLNEPLKDNAANVTLISAKEIKERGYQTLADAVSRISGFSAASNGGAGQSAGLFLRGFNSGHILILLDGMPLKDPTDPSFSAGLAHLRLDNVARIEVVKGAQSGLWGADATAGVINIITKDAAPGAHISFRAGLGSYSTAQGGVTLSLDADNGNFILSADHFKTRAFSAYEPRSAEADSYTNDTLHFKGTLKAGEYAKFSIFYHDIQGDFDYDSGWPINPNDNLSHGKFRDQLIGINYDYDDGTYTLHGSFGTNTINRDMNDSSYGTSNYHGQSTRATLRASRQIDDHQLLALGIDYNRYEGSSPILANSSFDNRGFYGSYRYIFDNLLGARTIINAVLRHDDFSTFESKTTYRFAIKRECNLLPSLFSSINIYSAYNAPSLYQYSTNNALKPESTHGFEISAGYDDLLKITYFRNKVKDRIDYDSSTWSYFNSTNDYTIDGIELEGRYRFDAIDLELSANWTHIFSLSDDSGKPILRVPHNEGNLFIDYLITPNIHLGANLKYVGKRTDYGDVILGSYTLLNLSYTQEIGSRLTLSLQAHNVLDRNYETIKGYSTEGRSIYGKVEYKF